MYNLSLVVRCKSGSENRQYLPYCYSDIRLNSIIHNQTIAIVEITSTTPLIYILCRMHVKPVQMRNFICGGVFRSAIFSNKK